VSLAWEKLQAGSLQYSVMAESIHVIPPFIETSRAPSRATLRPTSKEWVRHSILFFLTVLTTTFAGIMLAAPTQQPDLVEPTSIPGWILFVPHYYFAATSQLLTFTLHNPQVLTQGLTFSAALLTILMAHEMGHYLTCLRYGVAATLPFFIPAPPLLLAGTFGAFIKIKAPIPTRRALFDIGLGGPLAGFVALLPIAAIGLLTMGPPLPPQGHEIFFNDPLLLRVLARILGVHLTPYSPPNPCYMAAWIGLIVTSLNLMPVGQLDGGHGIFALFGKQAHQWIGRIAFLTMATLALLGWFWHGSPSGFLYTVLLAVMLRVKHPQPQVMEPLGAKRIWIAILTLIVFALSFWPFPITIS
jgi:membrane-associated protease RseP (regulator of RpoE activity)